MFSILFCFCGLSITSAIFVSAQKHDVHARHVVEAKISTNTTSVAATCAPFSSNVVCINHYGAVLPPSFSRDSNPAVGYTGTIVPDDPSWALVGSADFVVFDKQRGREVLGSSPKLTKMFDVLNVIHEAPVYVPALNKLYVAQDGPPGNLSSLAIDLNVDPPTLSIFKTNPPTYQPNGAVLGPDGMVYWAVMGNNASLPGGLIQRPGIARFNPATNEVTTLLNNYFGFFFSGPNDITIQSNGDIWFTDSDYSYGLELSSYPPANALATYRFRPSTGAVSIVENTLDHPNGIAFSPSGKTLYITDSGLESVGPVATKGQGDFYSYPINILFTSTGKRNIYAFDVNDAEGGSYLTNKRVVFQALEGAPDGLKVAKNGYLVAASGLSRGVDVLSADGTPLVRVQASHPVENVAFVKGDLWLVGISGISKVEWNLVGL